MQRGSRASPVKLPKWLEGGADAPTVVATLASLLAAPIGGLGVLALAFGAWIPAAILIVGAIALWSAGRYLLDR